MLCGAQPLSRHLVLFSVGLINRALRRYIADCTFDRHSHFNLPMWDGVYAEQKII